MAEKPTGKPRRDLRARLGKTITPKTGGAPAAEDPATAPAVASAAAPAIADDDAPAPAAAPTPTPAPRVVKATPAPVLSGGIAAPPSSIGAAPIPGVGVPAPPFARPAAPQQEAPSDPFASARVEQKIVRIEFDDKLVSDAEVGKGRKLIILAVAVVMAAVGAGIGFMGGQTVKENAIFERTVRDAVSIHQSVRTAKTTLDTAQAKMREIIAARAGNQSDGTPPHADFAAIEALRALERPFRMQEFTDKNYNALGPAVVNDLFIYATNVERLFQEFEALANLSLGQNVRADLDRDLAENGTAQQYGAVLRRNEQGQLVAGIALLEVSPPAEEGGQPTVSARPVRNAQPIAVEVYSGSAPAEGEQEAIAAPVITTQRQYAVLVDATDSPILRQITSLGAQYTQKLGEISQLLVATVEIQGRLLDAISNAITQAGGPPEE